MLSVSSLFEESGPGVARRPKRSAAAREEERRRLNEAMQELGELPRLALALRFFESARPKQIAAVLGLTEERVEAVLADAVREVTEILRRTDAAAAPAPVAVRRRTNGAGTRRAGRS